MSSSDKEKRKQFVYRLASRIGTLEEGVHQLVIVKSKRGMTISLMGSGKQEVLL